MPEAQGREAPRRSVDPPGREPHRRAAGVDRDESTHATPDRARVGPRATADSSANGCPRRRQVLCATTLTASDRRGFRARPPKESARHEPLDIARWLGASDESERADGERGAAPPHGSWSERARPAAPREPPPADREAVPRAY